MNINRVFLIVLDSLGIGELPDAAEFGDVGSNTLRSITPYCQVPNLEKLGLFNIDGIDFGTPVQSPKAAYGKVTLTEQAKLFDNIDNLSSPVHVIKPKYMEDIGQNFGYILYRTTVKGPMNGDGFLFHYLEVRDRAQAFVNGDIQDCIDHLIVAENAERMKENNF